MKRRWRTIAVFGVLALVSGMASPVTQAIASHNGNLTVQVSNPMVVGKNCDPDTGRGCRTGESMRFLTSNLKVHKGDTLTFDFQGFHTATLLPVGTDWLGFRQSSTGGVGKPFSIFNSDPDDTTAEGAAADKPAVKLNEDAGFPSVGGAAVTCGAPADPCSYDGTAVVNSGLPLAPPPNTFAVKINANPDPRGFWVMCLLHTHMVFKVTVVPDAEAASTQAEIDTAKATQIAFDQEWAEETDAKLINARSSHINAAGQKVYDVSVGQDSHWANLNGFYPKKTSIPKGATVRFHFSQLIYEDHTATMTAPGAFSLFEEFFTPMCDPDGDTGPGPDTADTSVPPAPPCGGNVSQSEIDITSRVFNGTGNGTFGGASDLEHSGIRGANFTNGNFDVKFTARSSKKGWQYFCMLHPMGGRIVVTPTK
jgi:plastocyanin